MNGSYTVTGVVALALFVGWLIAVVIRVGALNFVPALALGPIVEHLLMAGV